MLGTISEELDWQGTCPGCKGSFMYWPEKDPVTRDSAGVCWHARCWGNPEPMEESK